ncbi:MAG TPA: DUF2093 domain-containing protein [Novosphingobium sp.]|nr:DUF2093 domain-containing protein [Novosphingobium sp.]
MLMNSGDRLALLRYEPNGFSMISRGNYVLCAVSGEKIPLDVLRYWSVERQEAYASPEIATKRLLEQ